MSIRESIQEFFTKKTEEIKPVIDKKEVIQASNEDLAMRDFRPTNLEDKDKVEVIPATAEQKLQYSRHIDGIEFTDMPSVDFPKFTQAQLNSVPDIIDGVPVNEHEKKMILLNSFEYSASSNWSSTFSIDEKNKLVTSYLDIDANKEPFEIKRHVSKQDVMYVNPNEIELKQGSYKILTENNKELQNETVKLETPKHVQLSNESNLSIDNIYGFSPTDQQKKDLENGKGITGEIQGKNYYIQLSAQEKNKGSLQILSIEKAKEFKLISDSNQNQKSLKQLGLRA